MAQMNATTLKSWLLRGELEKLEHVVLEGRGARLLGEHSPDLRTRVFLKGLPNYLTKISHVHDAVSRGSLAEVQKLISEEPKKKLAIAKDSAGTPLLHKAVYHDRQDIVEWLVQNFPIAVQQKDREGRIALHYCAACKDPDPIWDVLIENDSDASIIDKKGNSAAYYLEHSSELELPEAENMSRRKTSFGKELLDFKPSNIRIWIHNRDIGKLQQVLWEGHGNKLRMETSNNPRVKRFLEAVPFIMSTVKDVHAAATNNDLKGLRNKIEATSPIILCAKDCNGLNVLHKAAGLGYTEIAREILAKYPSVVEAQDNEGKTPLHYAAAAKDDGTLYNLITEYGADESKLDHKQKAPAFYKNRPSDVDQSLLTVIPEAPRVAGTSYPKHWDWRILEAEDAISRGMKKVSSADIDSAFGSAESTTKNFSRSMEQIKNIEEDCDKEENAGEEENAENTEDTGDGENAEPTEDTENKENTENTEDTENVEAAEDAENSEESKEPETTENKEEDEAEEEKVEDTEERSSDDDVVTGAAIPETEENPTPEDEAEGEKPEDTEDEDKLKEEEKEKEEEEEEEEKEEGGGEEEKEEAGEEEGEGEKEKEESADAEDTSKQEEEESKVEQEERNEPSTGDSGVDDPGNDEDQVIVGEHEELPEAELNEGSMTADPEIEKLVENGNMEQLASLVLNGEGRRLVGRHSKNPELQAFIDRVPSYMGKIHAVHMAAREGNLRDLQSALDRRKFAVARDGSSPHGATPLHVAVIFGNTTIIRYLAGRFPETTHAIDLDGRTPLHYAATLADNGHYYNLLLHLGANPLVQDNSGEKAEYYKQNQSDFSHKSLLRDFGANEQLADEMLTDKDDSQIDIPIFREEEGRYLASSLGDPLIRGLTEVANTRPKDPVTYLATYLYNFANKSKNNEEQEPNVLIIPDRPEENIENIENDNGDEDAGYPRSPISDVPESAFSNPNRDEHGQSVIHFAAIRSYPKDGLFHLLQESQVNVGFRDELYRTARDVAELANIRENIDEIDRYVAYLAARGETEKLVELLLEGYDHILDVEDEGANIVDIAAERGKEATVQFLQSIPNYVTQREEVHQEIRTGNVAKVKELLNKNNGGGKLLAMGKNSMSRCALHIAVLRENVEMVRYIAKTYPETLRIGDNLERTALHYAMGLPSVEELSNILIKAGAKRIIKDLKSRQPSYYFMNKSDIERLQEEEESLAK
ncbi:uncharacterized protein LOC122527005 isoform X1 [Frieseomelitta varia]|uniref:uncharacterized protein LOC122527005 isoform X1 n=1 Tax=Frieseomelitta varia TaxID=561572 RepID=UPI001CB6942E|nr:uncharacterized protein LOC122527005 isoform X1 [Frieseomelitta varia]